jgi:hypothetical protein
LYNTYAAGLRSREQITASFFTPFDSDGDGFLDAVHLELTASTNGDPINVTAQASLIDPLGGAFDQNNCTWTVDASGDVADIDLHMVPGGEEGWYDVRVSLFDEFGVFEEDSYASEVAYLPELMVHDVAITDIESLKTFVAEGFDGRINLTLENQGHFTENLTITLSAGGTPFNVTQIQLSSKEFLRLTVLWRTGGWALGNYTITASLEPVSEETDLLDNSLIADHEVFVTIPGDVDGDFDVDVFDMVALAYAYGTEEGAAKYSVDCDVDSDGDIDIFDVVIAAYHYGESA